MKHIILTGNTYLYLIVLICLATYRIAYCADIGTSNVKVHNLSQLKYELTSNSNHNISIASNMDVSDIVVPSNKKIIVLDNIKLTVRPGHNFIINGKFSAPLVNIFSGNGSIFFGVDSVRYIYPQWWGALGDGLHDDSKALQEALNSAQNSNTIMIPEGTYLVSRTSAAGEYNTALTIPYSNITIEGVKDKSIIKLNDNQNCIILRTLIKGKDRNASKRLQNIHIKDLTIDGNWSKQAWAGPVGKESIGIYDQNGLDINTTDSFSLTGLKIKNCAQDGLVLASCTNGTLDNITVQNCGKGNINIFKCSGITISDCITSNPNDSPDNGITKPFYTLASEGYAGIGISYYPDASYSSSSQSNIKIEGCKIYSNNSHGRGINIFNVSNVRVVNSNITINGNRSAITIGAFKLTDKKYSKLSSDCSNIYLNNLSINSSDTTSISKTTRIISIVSDHKNNFKVSEVHIENVKSYRDGTSQGTIVLDHVSNGYINNVVVTDRTKYNYPSIDIRGCDNLKLHNMKTSGNVSFNTSVSNNVELYNNSFDKNISGMSFTNKLILL